MLEKFKKRAAFIPFVVTGHPDLELSEKIVDVLVEEGADLIELGVPFSDAMADGPVIQSASESASKKMDSIEEALKFALRISSKHPALPLILFTYFNPILKIGVERFAKVATDSGVSAVLVVDLPPEEAAPYLECLRKQNLKTIFLASPTTSADRFALIEKASTGFIYYVSRTGVTGVSAELSTSLDSELARVKNATKKGVAVGFGISNGKQAAEVAKMAEAVVVGSAFVRIASKNQEKDATLQEIRSLAREISTAIRGARC